MVGRQTRRSDRYNQDGGTSTRRLDVVRNDGSSAPITLPTVEIVPKKIFGEIDVFDIAPPQRGLMRTCTRCQKKGFLQKLDQYGLCKCCHDEVFVGNLKALHELRTTLTPEQKKAATLGTMIRERTQELSTLQIHVDAANRSIQDAERRAEELKRALERARYEQPLPPPPPLGAEPTAEKAEEAEPVKKEALLTPEQEEAAVALEAMIDSRKEELSTLQAQVNETNDTIADAERRVDELKRDLEATENDIKLEAYALYKPKYTFATAEEFKNKLVTVRSRQKQLVENQMAITGQFVHTAEEGEKRDREEKRILEDTLQLCLWAFNNECDAAINAVKKDNFDRCEARIIKACETVEKLGQTMRLAIDKEYLIAKLEELHLAYEFEVRERKRRKKKKKKKMKKLLKKQKKRDEKKQKKKKAKKKRQSSSAC